jgi:hypothetical protein
MIRDATDGEINFDEAFRVGGHSEGVFEFGGEPTDELIHSSGIGRCKFKVRCAAMSLDERMHFGAGLVRGQSLDSNGKLTAEPEILAPDVQWQAAAITFAFSQKTHCGIDRVNAITSASLCMSPFQDAYVEFVEDFG